LHTNFRISFVGMNVLRETTRQFWTASKPYKGIGMEGFVASWYAKKTGKSLHVYEQLARRLVTDFKPSRILEVAPGPGYLSVALAKLGQQQQQNVKVTGLDISHTFVKMAQDLAKKEGVSIDFQHGNASSMPFEGNSFDFIVCRAAFKNFSEPVKALNEMHRVLSRGGQAVIIDLNQEARKVDIDEEVHNLRMNLVDLIITKIIFQTILLPRAWVKEDFTKMASQSRFGECYIKVGGLNLEVVFKKK